MRRGVVQSTWRQILVALTGMVVCLGLPLALLPNAQALPTAPSRSVPVSNTAEHEPPGPGGVHAAAAIKDKLTFGKSTLRAAKQSAKIVRTAMSKSGKTLNYAKAKAVGGKTKWRRQFAAGFYWQGGTVTHISDAELAEVKKFLPPSPAVIIQREPNCRGSNKTVVVSDDPDHRIVDTYYDSCETIDLIFGRNEAMVAVCGIGSGTAGVVSLIRKIPRVTQALAVFGALCVFYGHHDVGKMNNAVAKSTLNALIVRSDDRYIRGPKSESTYYTTVRYYPQ